MDRRVFEREPTNLELYARAVGDGARRLRIRDISSDGVFVEGWSPAPRHGTEVSLTFLIGGGCVVKLLRRVARVTRVCGDGIGLVHGAKAMPVRRVPEGRPSPWSSLRWPDVD